MERDNYGLRTHFPHSQYIGFADDSREEDWVKKAAHRRRQNIIQDLESETSEFRDELRILNFFRHSLPCLQSVVLKVLPDLHRRTEYSESCPRDQARYGDEILRLDSELQSTLQLREIFRDLNAEMRKLQGALNKVVVGQSPPRSAADVFPLIKAMSPNSASIFYDNVGILSPAVVNRSPVEEEMTKDNVKHHLEPGDKSFPPTTSVSTSPARIYNIISKSWSFLEREKCYVYIIDPVLLQASGVACRSTPDLVKELGITTYSLSNPAGAHYVTPSHHICHRYIPAEAIIMTMRLDIFFLFLERTGIIGGTTSEARTLLDTSCTEKSSVQDYLDFSESHNQASASSMVELGPAANAFLSYRGPVSDDSVECLVPATSALQL
ncbi:hypothetical protein IFM61392_10229 [Aspergillus lentulus]|nr:hypothetical protein IFM61392_10229 [Aspergillus lentulus]